jgi:ABC-type uncharacterized transport system.
MEKVTIPRRTIRFNVTLQILAALVLLGAVNYFAFNHYARWDFSRNQKFVLADQTRRVLRDLKSSTPMRITVVFSKTTPSADALIFNDVYNLLKELVFSGRKNIKVEYVDQTRDPSRARELQAKYQFTAEENVVILDYDGRVKFVPVSEMAEFDLTPIASGMPPRVLAFKGEQALTNAIISLLNPERLKAYFLQGHGEPPVEGASPISAFKDYLERQNVRVAPLSLASLESIPADCAALFLVGLKYDLTEREAEIIGKYSLEKGRLLVLLDPLAKTPLLHGILQKAGGITPIENRVIRLMRLPLEPGITRILVDAVTGFMLEGNSITRRMAGMQILLEGPTQSLDFNVQKSQADGVQIWPLIRADEEFWGEFQYVSGQNKPVRYDDGIDDGYPVYVAAAAARGGVSDDRVKVENAKMVVVGNSDFVLDGTLKQSSLDFLLSASNWLMDRGRLTGVAPKAIQHFTLNLTDLQLRTINMYTMLIIPGAAALLGLIAWLRRRA